MPRAIRQVHSLKSHDPYESGTTRTDASQTFATRSSSKPSTPTPRNDAMPITCSPVLGRGKSAWDSELNHVFAPACSSARCVPETLASIAMMRSTAKMLAMLRARHMDRPTDTTPASSSRLNIPLSPRWNTSRRNESSKAPFVASRCRRRRSVARKRSRSGLQVSATSLRQTTATRSGKPVSIAGSANTVRLRPGRRCSVALSRNASTRSCSGPATGPRKRSPRPPLLDA